MDAKQVLEEAIHLVLTEHSIVQTDENLNYTMTETRKENRSLAFASSMQNPVELSVQFQLLQESTTEGTTALQLVEHEKRFPMTTFYVGYQHLEEGNKGFQLDKNFGFVHEQQIALQADWNEQAVYQKIYRVAIEHDKPVEGNTKNELHTMNAQFRKKRILTSR